MKDKKHIRWDFHSVTWYCPRVGLWGARRAQGGSKKFKHGHVAYQIDGDDEQNKMQVTLSS